MKTTNQSLSPLVFADGTVLKPGESKDLPDVDVNHHVHKTWVENGLVTVEKTGEAAKAKTKK